MISWKRDSFWKRKGEHKFSLSSSVCLLLDREGCPCSRWCKSCLRKRKPRSHGSHGNRGFSSQEEDTHYTEHEKIRPVVRSRSGLMSWRERTCVGHQSFEQNETSSLSLRFLWPTLIRSKEVLKEWKEAASENWFHPRHVLYFSFGKNKTDTFLLRFSVLDTTR